MVGTARRAFATLRNLSVPLLPCQPHQLHQHRFPRVHQLLQRNPGCALAPAPFGDGDEPYWFRSDGARVYLVARAEAATDTAQCPLTLPSDLTGVPILCLQFERPVQ